MLYVIFLLIMHLLGICKYRKWFASVSSAITQHLLLLRINVHCMFCSLAVTVSNITFVLKRFCLRVTAVKSVCYMDILFQLKCVYWPI
jgi:hypothetical protein